MGGIDIYKSWKSFINSSEGAALLTFITTKNSKEIGAWLKKLGAVMAEGKKGAVAKMLLGTGIKLAGVGVAAYIAYKEVKRQWDETKKIWTKDDINGFEKIARIALEAHPVTMTVRSIKAGWDWLTKSDKQRKSENTDDNKQLAPIKETDFMSENVKPGVITPQESGKQVVEYERSKANKQPTYKTTSDKFADYMKQRNKTNHPEWYSKFPEFITTNLNFGIRKEAQYFPVAVGGKITVQQVVPQRDGKVSQAYIDQLNVLFAKLRGSNSGAFNYTVSDLMAYIECVRAIRIQMALIAKRINSLNNIDLYITKTPDPVMWMVGLSLTGIQDLKDNSALYITRYNQYAELLRTTFPIAPDMAVFDRDDYVASIILEEGKGPKSSIYSYIFSSVVKAATGTGNEGKVEELKLSATTIPAMFTDLDTLINSAHAYVSATYSNFDTFNKIAGDMLKAYGQACVNRAFNNVGLGVRDRVQYDEYLLHQLQNAQLLNMPYNDYFTWNINPVENITYTASLAMNGNGSYSCPKTKLPGNTVAGTEPIIINTNKSDIKGNEAISLTRGNWYYKLETDYTYNTLATAEVITCDTLAFIEMNVVYFDTNNNLTLFKFGGKGYTYPDAALRDSLWSQLDYAPAMWTYKDDDNNGTRWLLEDLDTYAYMTHDQFVSFTDTAVISMYKTIDVSDQVNFRSVKRK